MSDAKKSLDGRLFFDFGEKKIFYPKEIKTSKFSVFAFFGVILQNGHIKQNK